jgi:catechol 2,3-dioxygenase-like lactoylglutathione lyase family enzyme
MITGIDRVLLRVPSLAAAVTYYRETLGLHLVRQEAHIAAFSLGTSELVLHDSPDLPAQAVYYRVDDLAAMYAGRAALNLKFASPPRPTTRGHTATVKDPFGNVLLLLDRATSTGDASGGAVESAAPAGDSLFAGVQPKLSPKREVLIGIYEKLGRTADDLPYTHHFESLYDAYAAHFPSARPTREEVWRHLLNVRKAGKLPKLGDARSTPPEISAEQRQLLAELLGEEKGRRDRLPYTPRFDALVEAFNRKTRLNFTPHQMWRLVATLAK